MLSIDVLGPLMVRCDGGTGGKLPRKASALFTFLMVSGQPVPRARLADLLWPYQGSEHARHSLRNCLLELRKWVRTAKAAEGRTLRSDFLNCSIGEDVTSDIHRFMLIAQHAPGWPGERADLLAACNLYRGEFLDGFHITSEPWDEWVYSTREELKILATDMLLRLSQLSSKEGRHDEAVGAARRLVQIDPLIECSHRQLMRAFAAGGRRSEAVQQYKKLVTLLRVELAVGPDIESQQLWRAIVAACRPEPNCPAETGPAGAPPVTIEPQPVLAEKDSPRENWPRGRGGAVRAARDALTEQLERLGSVMVGWEPGQRGLTLGMIKQAGGAMLAAAADRRREDLKTEVLTEPDLEYAAAPAPLRERIAA
jgi:DNA-binding SARP family transcriptional activator